MYIFCFSWQIKSIEYVVSRIDLDEVVVLWVSATIYYTIGMYHSHSIDAAIHIAFVSVNFLFHFVFSFLFMSIVQLISSLMTCSGH